MHLKGNDPRDYRIEGLPRWVRKTFTVGYFAAAATTSQKQLFSLPAHTIVHDAIIELTEVFAGGAVSAATLAVGIAADPDAFVEETDVFTGASLGVRNVNLTTGASGSTAANGARGASLWDSTSGDEHPKMGYYVGSSALAVTGDLVTTSANTNVLTTGKVTVYLLVSEPRKAPLL